VAHRLVLIRHGETDWSHSGQHTSRTDVALTERGREQAARLAQRLESRHFVAVFTSPSQRASSTAALAGLGDRAVVDGDLREWDYGRDEGLTTPEIRVDRPGWTVWDQGPLEGETADEVGARADDLLARLRLLLDEGDVALVGHGHFLRVVAARWLELDGREGRLLALDPGTISELDHEREQPVIRVWNS
jgi:probable phosphoglycerate mutase